MAYDTYWHSCYRACEAAKNETADICIEENLLGADLGDPGAFQALMRLCAERKHEVACRAMEAHPEANERIAYYEGQRRLCEEEYTGQESKPASCYRQTWRPKRPERTAVAVTPTRSSSASSPAVTRAVEQIVSDEAAEGFVPAADLRQYMGRGAASFELTIYAGLIYHVYVIGRDGMKFTATLYGEDFSPIEFPERTVAGDVYVRAMALDPTEHRYAGRGRLAIADTVGAHDTVRVIVFKPN